MHCSPSHCACSSSFHSSLFNTTPTSPSAQNRQPVGHGATQEYPCRTASSKPSTGELGVADRASYLTRRNNGLFNYWTLEQLPNFLLAAPVLLVSIIPSVSYLRSLIASRSSSAIPSKHHALLPFHLHHLLLTALLVFGSHTQIALRTAITDPVAWWNVASVAFRWELPSVRSQPGASVPEQTEKKGAQSETSLAGGQMTTVGRIWVGWVVVWGAVSLVLWSAHLPPA